MPFVAKNADTQVGKIVDALDAKGILDETLIVITADHAAQTGNPFFGVLAPGATNPVHVPPPSTGIRSDCNWYYGDEDADETYLDPSPAVAALRDRLAGNLAFSYQDTQVAAYLNDTSLAKKKEAAAAVLDMPGVMASYYIDGAQDDYTRFDTNKMTGPSGRGSSSTPTTWSTRWPTALRPTSSVSRAPTSTYGVIGDHGGSQKLVQNIPMVFVRAGSELEGLEPGDPPGRRAAHDPEDDGDPVRPEHLDGRAVRLSKPQG